MKEIKDMTLEDLLDRLSKLYTDRDTEYLKGAEFIDKLNEEIVQVKQEILTRFNVLGNALELACDELADIPIVIQPDFSQAPLELETIIAEEWRKNFIEQATMELEQTDENIQSP